MKKADQHPEGHHSEHRVEWWQGVSLGNVLTTITILCGGVGALVVFMSAYARSEEKIQSNAEEIKAVEVRVNKRIDEIVPKVDQVAQQVAVTNANLQLLLRAQGIKPIEAQP